MNQTPPEDVRMRGFARRTTVADAIGWLDQHVWQLPEEMVPLVDSAGRVLARDVVSAVSVPSFVRAMMDGFAVRAADTLGASPQNRLLLEVIGESMPGQPFARPVGRGEAVRIMTGSPMPDGADAVLPVEQVEIRGRRILAQGEVSCEKHVGQVGEDVAAGEQVLTAGRRLRPQDVGVLASIGRAHVPVVGHPRVRILVTGNELLPAGCKPQGTRIVDSNGPMLAALVARDGGVAIHPGIVPDHPEAILDALRAEADLVLVSGGSSVGQEDFAPGLVCQHGQLAVHGIAMRPGGPTGMGLLGGRLVVLLPGNPVSCLCAYDFFAGRAIRVMGGRSPDWPYRRVRASLRREVNSVVGRIEYLRVQLVEGDVEPLLASGSSILSSTTRADGFVIIPEDSEGYPAGSELDVFSYDEWEGKRFFDERIQS